MKTAEDKERLLTGLRNGLSLTAACREARWNRRHVYRIRDRDPEFAEALKEARAAACGTLYDALFREACGKVAKIEERKVRTTRDASGAVTGQVEEVVKKTVWHRASIGAAAMWLRNHDPQYVERSEGDGTSAEDAARAALAAMAELEAATAPAEPEPEPEVEPEAEPEETT